MALLLYWFKFAFLISCDCNHGDDACVLERTTNITALLDALAADGPLDG